MTYNEIAKLIEEAVQRRIQLKIKLNQIVSQNGFIEQVLKKNRTLLNLAYEKVKELKKSDLVDMEEYLRLMASCEPVMAVIDANMFRKQQNDSHMIATEREIRDLEIEKKRLEGMLNETSKVYNLFQEKDRKDR